MAVLIGVAAMTACRESEPDQNIIITNDIPAGADIEALPADESSSTPSDELANGAVEDNGAAAENQANSF